MTAPLPEGWTDDFTGNEFNFDPLVGGHWTHKSGATVIGWKDDVLVTWTFDITAGTAPLRNAFILAEKAAKAGGK